MTSIGIIGASSYVGEQAISIAGDHDLTPFAFSRRRDRSTENPRWAHLDDDALEIPLWIDVAPIASFTERSALIASKGAKKYVAISSTSLLTKASSPSADDREMTKRLERAERAIEDWGKANGIEWVILRPTIIYGLGKDRNICEIARLIKRLGLFPLFGAASGKRQPIHATDVAQACVSAVLSSAAQGPYNIAGGEVLTYREMVERIFHVMGRHPIMPTVPLPAFRAALAIINHIPRYRNWTPEMAERMNKDMVFSYHEAARDFGFSPGTFDLSRSDLPA